MAVEIKEKFVTWDDGFKYRINEGEEIILVMNTPRRTDVCTVFRLNAKNDVDCRQFWVPADDVDYFVPTSKAGGAVPVETYGLMITRLNALLAAKAKANPVQGSAAHA